MYVQMYRLAYVHLYRLIDVQMYVQNNRSEQKKEAKEPIFPSGNLI